MFSGGAFKEELELEKDGYDLNTLCTCMKLSDKTKSKQDIKDVLYSFVSKRGHSHMWNLQFDATPFSILFYFCTTQKSNCFCLPLGL